MKGIILFVTAVICMVLGFVVPPFLVSLEATPGFVPGPATSTVMAIYRELGPFLTGIFFGTVLSVLSVMLLSLVGQKSGHSQDLSRSGKILNRQDEF